MSGLISWRPGPGRDTHTVLSVVVSSPLRWRPCRIDHFAMVECSLCPVSLLVSLPPGTPLLGRLTDLEHFALLERSLWARVYGLGDC